MACNACVGARNPSYKFKVETIMVIVNDLVYTTMAIEGTRVVGTHPTWGDGLVCTPINLMPLHNYQPHVSGLEPLLALVIAKARLLPK